MIRYKANASVGNTKYGTNEASNVRGDCGVGMQGDPFSSTGTFEGRHSFTVYHDLFGEWDYIFPKRYLSIAARRTRAVDVSNHSEHVSTLVCTHLPSKMAYHILKAAYLTLVSMIDQSHSRPHIHSAPLVGIDRQTETSRFRFPRYERPLST